MNEDTMLVQRIANGTVVDHIPAGRALSVLRLLGEPQKRGVRVAIVMNVKSSKMGVKDLVKVEGLEIEEQTAQRLALIAPQATINIIREYEVVQKTKAVPPEVVYALLKCVSSSCITNKEREPLVTTFYRRSHKPLVYSCRYCGRYIDENEISEQLIGVSL